MSTAELLVGILLVAITIFYFLKSRNQRHLNLPPSPWGCLPLVGHLLRLGVQPHKTFFQWAQRGVYPPLISVQFGAIQSVVISDVKLLKEVLNDHAFAGRPDLKFVRDRCDGAKRGIIFTDGQNWSDQRRFTLRHLRDFGFGKKSAEVIILEEARELVGRLKTDIGKPFTTRNVFNPAVINVLWRIVTGERFKQDDPQLNYILDMLVSGFEKHSIAGVTMLLPWLSKVAPKLTGYDALMQECREFFEFIQKQIDKHEQSFQPGDCRSFIDVYIQEIRNTSDPDSVFHSSNSQLKYVLGDLFIAGAETTSTTLCWAFLYLTKFPQVQIKLHNEIDSVIGNSRSPSLSDRTSMDYTQAVIHEVLRCATIAPLAFFHSTTKHVNFKGYTIPEGMLIVPNIYAANNDPNVWGDPESFRPERFLDPKTHKFTKNDSFMSFSYGKRICPGETLAKDELFLFLTTLFQAFSVSPASINEELDISPIMGTVLMPKPHQLILKERQVHI